MIFFKKINFFLVFSLIFVFVNNLAYGEVTKKTNFKSNAYIISDGAAIFKEPDFDAEIVAEVPPGVGITVYKGRKGPFFRVKLQDGTFGYIADSEFQLSNKIKKTETVKKTLPQEEKLEPLSELAEKKDQQKQRPFSLLRVQGLSLFWVKFREDTMALKPTTNAYFIGYKMAGPDVVFNGAIMTEMNIMIKPGAPEYYEQATQVPATGWILESDFLFQNIYSETKNIISYFSFGPMFKYSKFDVGLKNLSNGKINYYSVEDMVIGGVFNVGFGIRMGSMALRGEYKYFIERMQYWSLGVSTVFPF